MRAALLAGVLCAGCPLGFEPAAPAEDAGRAPSPGEESQDARPGEDARVEDAINDGRTPDSGLIPPDAGLPCSGPCGACAACEHGRCVPLPEGASCGALLDCSALVKEAEIRGSSFDCYTYLGEIYGRCDGAGACEEANPASCAPLPRGLRLVRCSHRCARADHNCRPGTPATQVSLATICELDTETTDCRAGCVDSSAASSEEKRACDLAGLCRLESALDCGAYRCDPGGATCLRACGSNTDCTLSYSCDGTTCVP